MGKQSKILMLLCGLIVVLLVGSYFLIQATEKARKMEQTAVETPETVKEEEQVQVQEESTEEEKVPESKNGLMIGFDQSNKLTDVLMVGHVDTEQNKIKVVSIPRDFFIDFRKEPFKSIKKANPNNKIGYCKINEIYINMGAKEDGLETLKQVIEAITGLEIDYMATINVSGFKEVVDIVDGVEFDVPVRMYKMDPYQDPPLRIDLQPGLQLLDGEKAQGLVRFRGYPNGDFQRIKVQQEFIMTLFQKIVSSNVEQMTSLVKQIFKMVKADFGIVEIMDYLNYFLDKDIVHIMSNANMITLEGWFDELENGASIIQFDLEKTQKAVRELLEKDDKTAAPDKESNSDQSKDDTQENKATDQKSENKK
ncbi:hypothetical protein EII17_03620 [Clostridiales bacterium COT073_COT-073]|nr:hypothetical protein EII17_03620 [Clostridiales bacterium COT073_COT-073]